MKANLLPFDEINALKQITVLTDTKTKGEKQFWEDFTDILILCYLRGVESANDDLKTEYPADDEQMRKSIFKKIAGKTTLERVKENFVPLLSVAGLVRIIDTETHRVFNEAIYDTAKRNKGTVYKTWETILDDKVRDTHFYIQGLKVDIDDEFFTYDGDHALYPGDFKLAQNNVNCRCYITLSI